MNLAHNFILIGGVLCLLATFAGLASVRVGTPLLLAFIGLGMLAGEDGLGGITFNDPEAAYLVGSLALAAILFQGGLHTERRMVHQALWPSLCLATFGVALTTAVVGMAVHLLFNLPWPRALLLGAVMSPTDAAAVATLLRLSPASVPFRVQAALEIESGLNDPMGVVLTLGLSEMLVAPGSQGAARMLLHVGQEMLGGVAFGLGSGTVLVWLFQRLRTEQAIYPVLALGAALSVFGAAQMLGCSGFLAVYLAGLVVGNHDHLATQPVQRFFETMGWLAQIVLFIMLGLLATPHDLPPMILPALIVSAVLIFVARPAAVFACLAPFRWRVQEMTFISWVGLRGAVPIYLTLIPLLMRVEHAQILFEVAFVMVIASVIIQGWTITPAARVLGLRSETET